MTIGRPRWHLKGASHLHQRLLQFESLVASLQPLIRQAGNDSWSGVNLSQREERIVHDFLSGKNGAGLLHLNQLVPPPFLAHGFEVKFAGVFCHGHPRVTSFDANGQPTGGSCELGDLHLVFVFLDQAKNLRDLRAMIFQAKKALPSSQGPLISHPDQRYLYDSAEGFTYNSMLNGSRNWPKGRARKRALHYLFCGQNPARSASACAPAIIDFGELLFRFLDDSEGHWFRRPVIGGFPGWWHINWDLLEVVATAYFRGTSRGAGVADVLNHFNDFTDFKDFFLELRIDGESGMPTMFVIVKDRTLEPEN
jgi:hypothetical protein